VVPKGVEPESENDDGEEDNLANGEPDHMRWISSLLPFVLFLEETQKEKDQSEEQRVVVSVLSELLKLQSLLSLVEGEHLRLTDLFSLDWRKREPAEGETERDQELGFRKLQLRVRLAEVYKRFCLLQDFFLHLRLLAQRQLKLSHLHRHQQRKQGCQRKGVRYQSHVTENSRSHRYLLRPAHLLQEQTLKKSLTISEQEPAASQKDLT